MERPSTVEYAETGKATSTEQVQLFVDKEHDRLGIFSPSSPNAKWQVPLSHVIELLRATVL